jgi:hypothetical protein
VTGSTQNEYCYQQIHIDAARNATDDFNLFHDNRKWGRIHNNPFGMPIVLGFQLEALIEYLVTQFRRTAGEDSLIRDHNLQYANYQFTFADVVRPGEPVSIDIRKTVNRVQQAGQIANRIVLRKAGGLVLIGFQRESVSPLCMPGLDIADVGDLDGCEDRSWVAGDRYFMKRKFLNTGNGKNFLAGSLVDQHFYFDELENRVHFPAMFPVSLLSCALLEKARLEDYPFEADPVVYTSHFISIDRKLQENLRSNDRVHLLVGHAEEVPAGSGLGKKGFNQQLFRCLGLLSGNKVLFRAEVEMAPLREILPLS